MCSVCLVTHLQELLHAGSSVWILPVDGATGWCREGKKAFVLGCLSLGPVGGS